MIKEIHATKVPGIKHEITPLEYKRIELYRDTLIDYIADKGLEEEFGTFKDKTIARNKILKEIQRITFYLNQNKPKILTINELTQLA